MPKPAPKPRGKKREAYARLSRALGEIFVWLGGGPLDNPSSFDSRYSIQTYMNCTSEDLRADANHILDELDRPGFRSPHREVTDTELRDLKVACIAIRDRVRRGATLDVPEVVRPLDSLSRKLCKLAGFVAEPACPPGFGADTHERLWYAAQAQEGWFALGDMLDALGASPVDSSHVRKWLKALDGKHIENNGRNRRARRYRLIRDSETR